MSKSSDVALGLALAYDLGNGAPSPRHLSEGTVQHREQGAMRMFDASADCETCGTLLTVQREYTLSGVAGLGAECILSMQRVRCEVGHVYDREVACIMLEQGTAYGVA